MSCKRPVSVLVVIYSLDGQVLLLERSQHPGFWQSVTGSVENDELPWQTAQRETFEETGIAASASDFVDWHLSNNFAILAQWRQRYAAGVTHNLEHVFSLALPTVRAIQLSPTEHRASRWLHKNEAAAACFSWSNRDAILMLEN